MDAAAFFDGAFAGQRCFPLFDEQYLEPGVFAEVVGSKKPGWAAAYNDHIVVFGMGVLWAVLHGRQFPVEG